MNQFPAIDCVILNDKNYDGFVSIKCNLRFQAGNAEGILFLSVLEFGKTNLILKFDVSIKAWVGPDEGLPKNISQ